MAREKKVASKAVQSKVEMPEEVIAANVSEESITDGTKVIVDFYYTFLVGDGKEGKNYFKMRICVESPCKKEEMEEELVKQSLLCREALRANIEYTKRRISGDIKSSDPQHLAKMIRESLVKAKQSI